MRLNETFRVESTGSRVWKYRAFSVLLTLGVACSLLTLQPAKSAEEPINTTNATAGESGKPYSNKPDDKSSPEGSTKPEKGVGIYSGSTYVAMEDMENRVRLPGQELLGQPDVMKKLKITAEQKEKLQEIQSEYWGAKMKYFIQENKNLPENEMQKAWVKWQSEKHKDIKTQVEAILTPQQKQTLKQLDLSSWVFSIFYYPESLKGSGLTVEQKQKLDVIREEARRWTRQNNQVKIEESLAVLSSAQRAELQEEAFGPVAPAVETDRFTPTDFGREIGEIWVPDLFPYLDISQEQVQKELGLTKDQKNQVGEIMGGSSDMTKKFMKQFNELSPNEQKRQKSVNSDTFTMYSDDKVPVESNIKDTIEEAKKRQAEYLERLKNQRIKQKAEIDKIPLMKIRAEIIKQFEAVLTPDQLKKYKDGAFMNIAKYALDDPVLLSKIEAGYQQQINLSQISNQYTENFLQYQRETGIKMMEVLTPEQIEKISENFDQIYKNY
jgi:Spy/CpxP family protein refolding chaperone